MGLEERRRGNQHWTKKLLLLLLLLLLLPLHHVLGNYSFHSLVGLSANKMA